MKSDIAKIYRYAICQWKGKRLRPYPYVHEQRRGTEMLSGGSNEARRMVPWSACPWYLRVKFPHLQAEIQAELVPDVKKLSQLFLNALDLVSTELPVSVTVVRQTMGRLETKLYIPIGKY